jgi:amidohydrolase
MEMDPRIAAMAGELTSWRQDFHAHPELGFEETRTAGLVAARLEEFGIEVHRGVGRTGVVGVLRAGSGKGCIGLRADMDALPVQEVNTFAHRSRHDGRMHACGHDGHTAMLLGAAKHLAATRNFDGTVNFLFQPAEEGLGGALAMIEDGLFERFPCDAVFAMHNRPSLPVGRFAVRAGAVMAAGGFFDIRVLGRGAHGARPESGVDPVVVAAQIVTALQSIVSRNVPPLESAVVSVTRIHGGDAYNVIPGQVEIGGTVRAFSRRVMAQVEASLRRIATGVAEAHAATVEIDLRWIFPPTVNDPAEAEFAATVCSAIVGPEHVVRDARVTMASEDFAYMLEKVPGCYLNIGNGGGESSCEVHHPGYDFNDRALPLGVSFFVQLVETRLQRAV